MRKAISITLSDGNLLWLKGQAGRSAKGSVSDILDRIVTDVRSAGRAEPEALRSVVGTVDLPDEDPELATADGYIRSLFAASAQQPMLVRESKAKFPAKKAPRG